MVSNSVHASHVAFNAQLQWQQGMGEPLNNYTNVTTAIQAMINPQLWCMGAGHVTVSTVGVVKAMKQLSTDLPNVSLALSLHAPDQETREVIVPSAKAHPIEQLLEALDMHLSRCKVRLDGAVTVVCCFVVVVVVATVVGVDVCVVKQTTLGDW